MLARDQEVQKTASRPGMLGEFVWRVTQGSGVRLDVAYGQGSGQTGNG